MTSFEQNRDIKRFEKWCIYFAKDDNGLIKIGTSSNVPGRMRDLKHGLLHVIEGGHFRETAVHFLLRESRAENEYFFPDDRVMGFISSLKIGNYGGLIADLPKGGAIENKDTSARHKIELRPYRLVREHLGMSHADISNELGVTLVYAYVAEQKYAPEGISGSMVQYMVCKSRERHLYLDSCHFTGLFTERLNWLLALHKKNGFAS